MHLLVDNAGRPLVMMVSPRPGRGFPGAATNARRAARGAPQSRTPRTRPLLLRADKAYSARAHRAHLRRRGIKAVIPEPSDQAAHRKRRSSRGGQPVTYDAVEYKGRNMIKRGINVVKQWRGLATRYDKHTLTYRSAVVLATILT